MQTIYRYDIPLVDTQFVDMPKGAEILPYVIASDRFAGSLTLWAKVDTKEMQMPREISIVGTGNPVPAGMTDGPYVGTANSHGLVWHVFEVLPANKRRDRWSTSRT